LLPLFFAICTAVGIADARRRNNAVGIAVCIAVGIADARRVVMMQSALPTRVVG
jgi:hypothetical protein